MTVKFLKSKVAKLYLLWVLLNLIILIFFSEGAFNSYIMKDGMEDFWPYVGLSQGYGRSFADYYDITEFIFYTCILPTTLWGIYKWLRKYNKIGG